MRFLFNANAYAFYYYWCFFFIVKNCYKLSKWVYRGMVEIFLLGILCGCPKPQQNTLLSASLWIFRKMHLWRHALFVYFRAFRRSHS